MALHHRDREGSIAHPDPADDDGDSSDGPPVPALHVIAAPIVPVIRASIRQIECAAT